MYSKQRSSNRTSFVKAIAASLAILSLTTPAAALTMVDTKTRSLDWYNERMGPFGSMGGRDELTETAAYSDRDFPALATSRTGLNSRYDNGLFSNGSSDYSTSNFTSGHVQEMPRYVDGSANTARGKVALDGTVSAASSMYRPLEADRQSFSGYSSEAGWNTQWLVPATSAHAAGTAGRLGVLLTMSGSSVIESAEYFDIKTAPAKAVATIGGKTITTAAGVSAGTQLLAGFGYVDFLYGQAFEAGLRLTSSNWETESYFRAGDSFSAKLDLITLPTGTTLIHDFGAYRIATSSDPMLYPGAGGTTPVPEPTTAALFLAGLAVIGMRSVRLRRRAA